jgi:hypothetical protein
MAISQRTLFNKAASFQRSIYESKQVKASYKGWKSAFLCHSHRDEKLVDGLLAMFEENGIELYIDWKDHAMPDTPNVETAKRIQYKIKTNDIFLFLATANSKASRWCPWEIGYGDSSNKRIYIISTSDDYDTYGNEYLELYPKIDHGSTESRKGLAIFKTGNTNGQWATADAL